MSEQQNLTPVSENEESGLEELLPAVDEVHDEALQPYDFAEQLATESVPARPSVLLDGALASEVADSLSGEDFSREPPRAKKAFDDYVRMGKGRTLKLLAERYVKPDHVDWTDNFETVFRTVKEYSTKFKWQERLRILVTKASAEVLASAQRDAFVHTKERIKLSQKAQEAGMFIIEKANLKGLDEDEARRLLKPAATLLQLGLTQERAEQGDMLTVIRPEKPVEQMTDSELNEFAETLQKALR